FLSQMSQSAAPGSRMNISDMASVFTLESSPQHCSSPFECLFLPAPQLTITTPVTTQSTNKTFLTCRHWQEIAFRLLLHGIARCCLGYCDYSFGALLSPTRVTRK